MEGKEGKGRKGGKMYVEGRSLSELLQVILEYWKER